MLGVELAILIIPKGRYPSLAVSLNFISLPADAEQSKLDVYNCVIM